MGKIWYFVVVFFPGFYYLDQAFYFKPFPRFAEAPAVIRTPAEPCTA
jgi:hypothetical protein